MVQDLRMAENVINKIGLLSPCGWGNLGDAAIQEAMIHHIQSRIANSQIYGFTLNPEDTEHRHNIPSYPIASFSTSGYKISVHAKQNDRGTGDAVAQVGAVGNIKNVCKRVPVLFSFAKWCYWQFRKTMDLLQIIRAEIASIIKAKHYLKGFKLLIVSGGGQLDDFWGGAWGHPYALFKWAVIAKLSKAKFVFLSVGMSSLDSRLSRLFVRGALSLAMYRSYRDKDSKRRLSTIFNTENDPVLPDLAFSLPVRAKCKKNSVRNARFTVGVSPISYKDPRCWPVKEPEIYDCYTTKLAKFATWLVDNNYNIMFFASNKSDFYVIDDIKTKLTIRNFDCCDDRISFSHAVTVNDLLLHLDDVDFVIASRLHGVILSHMMNLPVLAISHDPKVNIHMDNTGQSAYCVDIEKFGIDTLVDKFGKLQKDEPVIKDTLNGKINGYVKLLNNQYTRLFSCSELVN